MIQHACGHSTTEFLDGVNRLILSIEPEQLASEHIQRMRCVYADVCDGDSIAAVVIHRLDRLLLLVGPVHAMVVIEINDQIRRVNDIRVDEYGAVFTVHVRCLDRHDSFVGVVQGQVFVVDEVENAEHGIHSDDPGRLDVRDQLRGVPTVGFHHPDAAMREIGHVEILSDPVDGDAARIDRMVRVFEQQLLRNRRGDGARSEMSAIDLVGGLVHPVEHAVARVDGDETGAVLIFDESMVMNGISLGVLAKATDVFRFRNEQVDGLI